MSQGLTHSYHGLLGIRFLMGIVETGLPAGAGLLIASYYRKKELSLRFALFFAFGQCGSCFSGVSVSSWESQLKAARLTSVYSSSRMRSWIWMVLQAWPDGAGKSSVESVVLPSV